MKRCFNVTGPCDPRLHYMVDIRKRLQEIKALVDSGAYFTMNRARQYGKTTTLNALADFLKDDYIVIQLDFQKMSGNDFADETAFSNAFAEAFVMSAEGNLQAGSLLDGSAFLELQRAAAEGKLPGMRRLFLYLSRICAAALCPLVLIIDEVDSAANNQVFLDFLAQLRGYYLTRNRTPVFQSVILAGVYDIKNIQMKMRPDQEHRANSPRNIAADFDVVMSFSREDVAGMLREYEKDSDIRMNVEEMARFICDYTAGYPFLVSRICKLLDEKIAGSANFPDRSDAWTKEGGREAVRILLSEKNTLFDSLMGKIYDYPELKQSVYSILFSGEKIVYNPDARWMDIAEMLGFVKNINGSVMISNRIFEMRLYNYFLTTNEAQGSPIFKAASRDKTQYINNGRLDMEAVLKKYVEHFDSIYGDTDEAFSEEEGRRRFLLYLRPIINGVGNYYIEAETRNARRMDIVVDYGGDRFVIELKIWRGRAYNERGKQQLIDYLNYFQQNRGYMLSYNFNKKKQIGVHRITIGEKTIIEAVV